ncbi:thiosulfate oxidation carrier protein SoxY [Palleronia pelagia]|uniref:Thiosulfate-binding protein SoxY n=1 Tax=Palleronia pelagia TaxID=387096 RepID=A0A1H8LP01_9RHOB|nr:thiosulfate oxidation carrier protein SoxY [Palleronia pelagia]SEO06814.1 thiosulfate-binding protein SoxY [Palleronia pelagia]
MNLSRRRTLALGAAAAIFLPRIGWADATTDAIAEFTGGADLTEGGALKLTAPEIAENGNTVPIEVDAPGAEAILILATGNPNPDVGTFHFGPLSGAQMASTRIRLAGTQDVVAVAKMADGTFQRASQEVKVTIGGCGG